MGESVLGLYNTALRWLEERKLATLTEKREPRYYLDDEWERAVNFCLQTGYWKFALRMVMATPDTTAVPNFGRTYSYQKPSDWIRTYQVSPDDRFIRKDRRFLDQNNVWYSDLPYFYVRYLSKDPDFGWNMSLWTPAFAEYLGGYLALMVAPRIKQASDKTAEIEKRLKKQKAEALALDAMDAPPGEIERGTWVQSRTPRGSVTMGSGGWDEY